MNATRRIFVLAVLAAFAGASLMPAAIANPTKRSNHPARLPPAPKRSDTHVYLMRGLFGIFSLGMDDLAGKLNGLGYKTEVYGWDSWEQVVGTASGRYGGGDHGPIVVIGHSLGANAVFGVADALQQQAIPVAIGVTFDATEPGQVPENVAVFINFWARDGFGQPVEASPDYTGDLENYDLSTQPGIDHTNIDALDQFHQFIIGKLDEITSPD